MSKLPHGWYLLCDNGESETAGEFAEYLFCYDTNSAKVLQDRYNVDAFVDQLVQVMAVQPMYGQLPSSWMVGVCTQRSARTS